MSIESRIITALGSYVLDEISPNVYTGSALEYIEFTYDVRGDVHAESKPNVLHYEVNLHWYLPSGVSPLTKRKQMAEALLEAGFTYPSIINASDGDGQHYEFIFEGIDGDGPD